MIETDTSAGTADAGPTVEVSEAEPLSPAPSSAEAGLGTFTSSKGDGNVAAGQVAGNVTVNNHYATEAAYARARAAAHDLARLRRIYVRATQHEDAIKLLAGAHVLLLYGPVGVGKRTAACCLLAEHLGGERAVNEVAQPATRTELLATEFESESGFVMKLDTSLARDLTETDISILAGKLKPVRSCLVVYAAYDGPSLSIPVPHVRWSPPPHDAVVAALLSERFGHDRPDWHDPILRSVASKPHLTALDDAVQTLYTMISDGTSEADALALLARSDDDLRSWLEDGADDDVLTTMMTLSVLAGAPVTTVAAGERLLRDMLKGDAEKGKDDTNERPSLSARFGAERRYARCRAKVTVRSERGRLGSSQIGRVVFEDPRTGESALKFVWRQPDVRIDFADWIVAVGLSANDDAARRAAWAAGQLAVDDYDSVYDLILRHWLDSPDWRGRECLAWVIDPLAAAEHARTLTLLSQWLKSRDDGRQVAAALACGGHFGITYPKDAMRILRTLARRERWPLNAISRAVASMYANGSADPVLAQLVRSTSRSAIVRDDRRSGVGNEDFAFRQLIVFLNSSTYQLTGKAKSYGLIIDDFLDDSTPGQRREAIATLFGRCLQWDYPRSRVEARLRQMVKATHKGQVEPAKVATFADVLGTSAEREGIGGARGDIRSFVRSEASQFDPNSPARKIFPR